MRTSSATPTYPTCALQRCAQHMTALKTALPQHLSLISHRIPIKAAITSISTTLAWTLSLGISLKRHILLNFRVMPHIPQRPQSHVHHQSAAPDSPKHTANGLSSLLTQPTTTDLRHAKFSKLLHRILHNRPFL